MNTKFPGSLLALLVAGLLLVGVPTAATATTLTEDLPGDYITDEDVARLAVPNAPQTLFGTKVGDMATPQCIVCGVPSYGYLYSPTATQYIKVTYK